MIASVTGAGIATNSICTCMLTTIYTYSTFINVYRNILNITLHRRLTLLRGGRVDAHMTVQALYSIEHSIANYHKGKDTLRTRSHME